MAITKEIKLVGAGSLDRDTNIGLLKQNDFRLLYNARKINTDGKNFVVRNIKSTKQITVPTGSATAVVIGTVTYSDQESIIYFLADTNTDTNLDQIIQYYPADDSYEVILKDSILNFDKDYPIRGAKVIDGKLYWNTTNNPPRKLNIEKAKLYTSGDYVNGYPSIDEQTISLIKYPMLDQINPYYYTDEDKNMNNLRGLFFQFRTAYVYDDDEVSVCSPISKVALPVGEMDYSGEVVGQLKVNNCIKFQINTGHHTVKKIIIYVRVGNNGDWGELETIDKTILELGNNEYYTYSFYNDRVILGADQTEINRLYHSVPLFSDYMGFLHTNNLLLAGNTEGYENVNPFVAYFTSKTKLIDPIVLTTKDRDWSTSYEVYQTVADPSPEFVAGMQIGGIDVANLPTLNNVIRITVEGQMQEFIADNDDATDPDSFRNSIKSIINNNFTEYTATTELTITSGEPNVPSDAVFVYSNSNHECIPIDTSCEFSITIEEYNIDVGSYRSYPGWKSGAEHPFGIIYYDEQGRGGFVQKAGSIYLPFQTEAEFVYPDPTTPAGEKTQNTIYSIFWNILHRPPSWATKYQWVRQKNTSEIYFRRYIINGITAGEPDPDKTSIDISPLNQHKIQYNDFDFSFPNSSIDSYSFQKGDRVRFITKAKTDFNDPPTGDGEGLGFLLSYFLDLEILEYKVYVDPTTEERTPTNSIIVQRINTATYTDIGENTLIEIYRPKREQENLAYYEMGEIFPIIDDPDIEGERIHVGPLQNQSFDVPPGEEPIPARGEFKNGDIYLVPTLFSKNLALSVADKVISMIESASASNFYDLQVYNIGRPNIPNKKAKQKKNLNIRPSQAYFEGTEINGLSDFNAANDVFVSSEFGEEINGLFEVGYTLKVLQKNKNTSFYVGRTGLQLATSTDQQITASSDQTLGTKSPSLLEYGTEHPLSVMLVNRHGYFVDVSNAAIVRDSANGMQIISDEAISSDILQICNLLTQADKQHIITGYNPKTKEIIFLFASEDSEGNITPHGTYVWHEKREQWVGVYEIDVNSQAIPSCFGYVGSEQMVSFVGYKLFKHESGTDYNKMYGYTKTPKIQLIFNQDIEKTKLFKTIEYTGIGTWGSANDGDVDIPEEYSIDGFELYSRLKSALFKRITGKKYAPFLKAVNSNSGDSKTKNLIDGKDLKGRLIIITLSAEGNDEAHLSTVSVIYQTIEIS